MLRQLVVAAVAAAPALAFAAGGTSDKSGSLSPELSPPVRIEAGGRPIDTEVGHAAPFVGDFDGDNVPDLLVGQFGGGALWVLRNEGTAAAPKLAAGRKYKDGGPAGTVPFG